MDGKMKVAVMNGIGKMGFEERDIPTPKADEVLVKLDYVGICGSDLHYYETGAIGDYVVEPPFVLGHEPGGVVGRSRRRCNTSEVGDRVALEPGKNLADTVNSVRKENIICVRMLYSLQHHRLMEYFRSM